MNRKNHLLRWMVISTALALLGIVVLQAYWLRTSYLEQQSRFRADVENALMASLIKSQISVAIDNSEADSALKAVLPQLGDVIASIVSKIPESVRNDTSEKPHTITLKMSGSDSAIERYLKQYPQMKRDSGAIHLELNQERRKPSLAADLEYNRKLINAELTKRAITTPFALALFDSSGRMLGATSDTQAFKRIPVKSALTDGTLSPDGRKIQIAFPDANMFLLRRMVWLLAVTSLLIIFCCVSFGMLIRLFFRQKRLSDMRNDFMNNMTHELKTPIASVSVALELMQDRRQIVNEEKKAEYLGIAQSELQRLSMLVEKVLKMAYFERGEIKISPEPMLAAAWLNSIMNSMRPVFEVANAKVNTKVQPELMMIYADKTHLTNIIQNLMENALKYNGTNEPRIQVNVYEDGASTFLRVIDNGRGIPNAYLDKVFDKFFRVPTGDRHDTKGYGLGLSYVKAIAELHGGTVSVSSVPDEETMFTVRLPRQSAINE